MSKLFCCMALSEIRMRIMIIGMSKGKDKIAIKLPLLLALEAIAEIIENVVANPIAPNTIYNKNEALSTIG